MKKLTKANYFDPTNKAISNSKVSDFLKSKEYYYKKHITRELKKRQTDPMKVGSIVDSILSGEEVPYSIKVFKYEDASLFEKQKNIPDERLVTRAMADKALELANAVMAQPFYDEYATHHAQFQRPVEGKIEGTSTCGLIDILTNRNGAWFIDDVKTTTERGAADPKHWYWHAQELGYFRQLGAYRQMLALELGTDPSTITCRHIVASKVEDDLFKVRMYILPHALLSQGWEEFEAVVKLIAQEKEWKDAPLTWESGVELTFGAQEEEMEEEQTEE